MSEIYAALTFPGWMDAVVRMTLASGAVLLAVLVADLALARRVSARWRAALYLAVFVRLLLPSGWASPLGLLARDAPAATAATALASTAEPVVPATAPIAASLGAATHPSVSPLMLQAGIVALLLAAWLLARVAAARSLRGGREASERLRRLAPGTPVLEHPRRGPAVYGLFRPRIVVPTPLVESLDDEALGAILRHEAAHVARRDPWRLALLQLATFAAWPLVPAWIAAWRVRGLMEQACDEAALSAAGAGTRRAYGEALLRVAEWQPLSARLALGMLPFGGGLAPRLRALRFTRRWPAALQAALVVLFAVSVVVGSGTRVASAEAGAEAGVAALPPGVAGFRVEIFAGDVALPDGAVRSQHPLTLEKDGETSVTFVERVDAAAARAVLHESTKLLGDREHWTWIGYPLVVNYKFRDTTQADGGSVKPVQVVVQVGPRVEEGELTFRLGLPVSGGFATGDVVMGLGDALLVGGPEFQGAPLRVLVTPVSVEWSGTAATLLQPRMDIDVDAQPVEDVLAMLGTTFGGLAPIVEGDTGPLTLHLKQATVAEIVAALAQQAGLEAQLDGSGRSWKLRPTATAAQAAAEPAEIEHLREALDRIGLASAEIRPRSETLDVEVSIQGPEDLKRIRTELEASGLSVGEMLVTKQEGRPVAVLKIARREAVTIRLSLWSVDDAVLRELLPLDMVGSRSPMPFTLVSPDLQPEFLETLRRSLIEVEKRSEGQRARLLSMPAVRVELGQSATVSSESGSTRLSFDVTPRRDAVGKLLTTIAVELDDDGIEVSSKAEASGLPFLEIVRSIASGEPILLIAEEVGRN